MNKFVVYNRKSGSYSEFVVLDYSWRWGVMTNCIKTASVVNDSESLLTDFHMQWCEKIKRWQSFRSGGNSIHLPLNEKINQIKFEWWDWQT